jgi:hypothetical protein
VQIDIRHGTLAPAKMPPAIIEKMSRAIADALRYMLKLFN